MKLTGVVVAMDEFASGKNRGILVITLDDSSGTNIECTCAAPPKAASHLSSQIQPIVATRPNGFDIKKESARRKDGTIEAKDNAKEVLGHSPDGPILAGVEIGSVIKAKGGLGLFRGQKQVRLKRIEVLRSTSKEIIAWKEIAAFQKDVLGRPWQVGMDDEARCKALYLKEGIWKTEEDNNNRLRSKGGRLRNNTGSRMRNCFENGSLVATEVGREEQDEKKTERPWLEKGLGLETKANYASKSARMRAAMKHDSLGI